MPQAVRKNDNPQAQEQHMHQWFRAPGVEMTRWRTRLGLFRTWGKTREAGDPLGESHISFTTLSLLTIHAIAIYRPGTLFPPVTTSPPTHHLYLNQRAPDLPSYALPSNQARSISYQCGGPSGTKQMTRRRFSFVMDAINITCGEGISCGDLKASGMWQGAMPLWRGVLYYYVYLYFVLHTRIIRGNGRNPRNWVAE